MDLFVPAETDESARESGAEEGDCSPGGQEEARLRGRKDAPSGRCTCSEEGHAVSCP